MKKTVLNSKHKELGAKLVDFAGWEMPINYPAGIIKESSFVRESCGMFDVSHMGRIEISGKNVKRYIEKILPIDINAIKKSAAKYTLLRSDEMWDLAEEQLRKVIKEFDSNFEDVEGEGAFYGPKTKVI